MANRQVSPLEKRFDASQQIRKVRVSRGVTRHIGHEGIVGQSIARGRNGKGDFRGLRCGRLWFDVQKGWFGGNFRGSGLSGGALTTRQSPGSAHHQQGCGDNLADSAGDVSVLHETFIPNQPDDSAALRL